MNPQRHLQPHVMSDTASMAPRPPTWSCSVCGENHMNYTFINISGDDTCPPCVKSMFDKALKHEYDYPPTWASIPLHPKHFDHIISAEFIKQYELREREYLTPPASRVYCKHKFCKTQTGVSEACGAFVAASKRDDTDNELSVNRCSGCAGLICMKCATPLEILNQAIDHSCGKRVEEAKLAEAKEEEQAFAGLKQGRHWQLCPNVACARRVELGEACNHMTCAYCKTSFCFVCGTPQEDYSRHWRRGGCPRYNSPGDENAGYDDEESDHDNENGGNGDGGGGGGWEEGYEGYIANGIPHPVPPARNKSPALEILPDRQYVDHVNEILPGGVRVATPPVQRVGDRSRRGSNAAAGGDWDGGRPAPPPRGWRDARSDYSDESDSDSTVPDQSEGGVPAEVGGSVTEVGGVAAEANGVTTVIV